MFTVERDTTRYQLSHLEAGAAKYLRSDPKDGYARTYPRALADAVVLPAATIVY